MGELSRKTMAEREQRMLRLNRVLSISEDRALTHLKSGKNFVPGRGSLAPKVVFVGEAPGRNEHALRQPFIGQSGRLLDELMRSIGLSRESVYITNCVKWWPTTSEGNTRQPTPFEKDACRPFLVRELSIIKGWHVVALGKHAASTFLPADAERGKWHPAARGPGNTFEPFRVLPLYHPAVGLYQASKKPLLFEEFSRVLEALRATE